MKEGTETQLCYLEVGHLSKWRSHAKIWAPISKIERDFKRTVHEFNLKKFTNSVIGEENVNYSCTECNFVTMYKQNLTMHFESKHSDSSKEFQCEECGSKFTEKRNLKRHIDKIHGEPDAFVCEFCDFKTKFEFNLRRHKDEKHEIIGKGTGIKGRQSYSCKRCDFTTFDQNQMYSHNTNIHNIS